MRYSFNKPLIILIIFLLMAMSACTNKGIVTPSRVSNACLNRCDYNNNGTIDYEWGPTRKGVKSRLSDGKSPHGAEYDCYENCK